MTQATQTSGIDAARLSLMLNDLRLPAIKQDWPGFAERADKESWAAARLLLHWPNTRLPNATAAALHAAALHEEMSDRSPEGLSGAGSRFAK